MRANSVEWYSFPPNQQQYCDDYDVRWCEYDVKMMPMMMMIFTIISMMTMMMLMMINILSSSLLLKQLLLMCPWNRDTDSRDRLLWMVANDKLNFKSSKQWRKRGNTEQQQQQNNENKEPSRNCCHSHMSEWLCKLWSGLVCSSIIYSANIQLIAIFYFVSPVRFSFSLSHCFWTF